MGATYNRFVREGWRKAADEIREPLRQQMRENLGASGNLDSWLRRMFVNHIEPASHDPEERLGVRRSPR